MKYCDNLSLVIIKQICSFAFYLNGRTTIHEKIIINCFAYLTFKHPRSSSHHGPIGIMADHFHKKGEWMVSLRFANMEMKKNILNGNSISTEYPKATQSIF